MLENFRIRVFRTVAHHLNFSRAAEELLLTQPAVTQQVKALEDELGVPLFDRSGGRITLTAGGISGGGKRLARTRILRICSDSYEGHWMIEAAIDEAFPAPVVTAAHYERFSCRGRVRIRL